MRSERGLLLTDDSYSAELRNVAKVLGFFGISTHFQTTTQLQHNISADEGLSKVRVVCSCDTFLRLITTLERTPGGIRQLQQQIHSAFVYAGEDVEVLRTLARKLTGDNEAVVNEIRSNAGNAAFSDGISGFCGPMAGLNVTLSGANVDRGFLLNTSKGFAVSIISLGQGTLFAKLEYRGITIFLSTSGRIIDIDAGIVSGVFDIRDHVLSAVPIVTYVRWAFKEVWHAPQINASLIIDDPLLKPTYGFFNFREFLSLMNRQNFSTSVAFIPWNWRRSKPRVVRLFRENPEAFSIAIHGCDHTRSEFGTLDRQRLYYKANQGLARMKQHESRTGIRHDRVFVFPQGVFSEAAMSVLKHTDLIAAVNSETISADPNPRTIAISDLWDIAVMRYSTFPIFTRRYPWEGIENFAFDALLGKPIIIVIHHDFCGDGCRRLVDFVKHINALSCRPTWRSLGEVVRRSCRQREALPGVTEVEMYGTELLIENTSGQVKRITISRLEIDPSVIKEIYSESRPLAWKFSDGHIQFELELKPSQTTAIRIEYHGITPGECSDNLAYKIRTMLRRCLSEARDNYFMKYLPSLSSRFFQLN